MGQITTLGDLKTLGADDPLLIENLGTGTGSWASNKYTMSVTSGQWRLRRSRQVYPYFSGKVQNIEMTHTHFHTQANVVKDFGYYSSSTASPFDSGLDGFIIRDDGTTKRILVYNNGTVMLNVPMSSWNGDPYA